MDHAEQQQGDGVFLPAHRTLAVDAAHGVDAALDRREEVRLTFEDAGDIESERDGGAQDQNEDEGHIGPTGDCHFEYP